MMPDLTAPWSPAAESAIRQSLRVIVEARATHPSWAEPIVLDVISGTVTFDETWSPHVQGTLTCTLPDDQSTLDLLDPRDLVRIEVDAGYVYPGGVQDVHPFVNLGLRAREVNRPDVRMVLTIESDEALLQDAGTSQDFESTPNWNLPDMIAARLPVGLGYTPAMDMSQCPQVLVPVLFNSTTNLWTVFKEACDTAHAWLRDRGDRTWIATEWHTTAGQPVHLLRTGVNGTVVQSDVTLSRVPWYNVVDVTYVWDDGASVVIGRAWLTGPRQGITGEFGDALPGIKLYQERRQGQASQEQARAAAAAILTRTMRAAREASVTARSAFWVRPGKTVNIQLPLGPQETHLVARATFDLARGEMTLQTRQPDDTPISTGV